MHRRILVGRITTCILLSLVSSRWVAATGEKAGRNWHIGDVLPDSVFTIEEWADESSLESTRTVLILFTRSEQKYSDRIYRELDHFFDSIPADSLLCINIHHGEPFAAGTFSWKHVNDDNFDYSSGFGLKVHPTVMILSKKGELLAYFPGFNQALVRHLNNFLSTRHPTQFHIPEEVTASREEKQQQRRESLTRALYLRGKHQLALMELATMDTLTTDDYVLMGYALLKTGQLDSAQQIFNLLFTMDSSNFVRMGLGILAFKAGDYEQAANHFSAVTIMKDMYRVHYWRGLTFEMLGDIEQAASEFKKSARQSNRRIKTTFLP